ncbi:hypothetical protein IOC61_03285 [Halomonas sp. KAO]|uniref:hypothetical protein n=1 Tax=Halomonas sp. KAO TaxID=2783858 RepID=UPI0018A01651|nr:hypothetical protein [Halomonas sp. KAO]MBF7052339.1 hypothetical protein [Halomonas sp. KAO]
MKKFVVHAGPHKTGTTYIQSLLHNNRDALHSQGVVYPEAYYLFLGHHYLLNALNGSESCDEVRRKILDATAGAETCIISSENFISLHRSGLIKLKDAFPEVEFRFVLYSRRPSIRLLSRWHELVKQGSFQSLESYFISHLMRPMQSRDVNIVHYLKDLASIFGGSCHHLVDYDTAAYDKNIMSCFFKAAGIDPVVKDQDSVVNKMERLEEVEIIRALNYKAKKMGILKASNIREAYYRAKSEDAGLVSRVESLVDLMKGFSNVLALGDAGFDAGVRRLLDLNYSNRFVNRISTPERKEYIVPSADWTMDAEALQGLGDISKVVFEKTYEK